MALASPRNANAFHFVDCDYGAGTARLRYQFDAGPVLVEHIVFPDAPMLAPERASAFAAALNLLHWIAGISYYKAGVPPRIEIDGTRPDAACATFLDAVYLHGLGEFAYQNKLDLTARIAFPFKNETASSAAPLPLPRRTLVPIGGGKDSLVSVEALKLLGEPATAVWIGESTLIARCAERTGLPTLNIGRKLAPELFEYNRAGAYNGHIPVTAINSAILLCAATLYGFDAIAFSNERSASSATLEYAGRLINHQWSKSIDFERGLREVIAASVAPNLDYFSLLRPWSELAVTRAFGAGSGYDDVFSSCNRNFRILGERSSDRWCGQCPKCHFVFLALAPFVAKPRLLAIFGRNLLDDASLAPAFDALMEYRDHKPFECVGEGREARAAMAALSARAEWREDALVARFAEEIAPTLDPAGLDLQALLRPAGPSFLPARLASLRDALG